MAKLLVFDIWGDYAHFKKPYTTTSPLTYSIPSRTTLTGIIGAILGVEKEKNNIAINRTGFNLGLRIISPVKKTRIGTNYINTKGKKFRLEGGRSPLKIELLVNPHYRIYAECKEAAFQTGFKEMLVNHRTIYTISLGLAGNLADFEYKGEFEYSENKKNEIIHSVIPMKNLAKENIKFEEGKEYFTDTFAMEMDENREVTEYDRILFERNGNGIIVSNVNSVSLENGDCIMWL